MLLFKYSFYSFVVDEVCGWDVEESCIEIVQSMSDAVCCMQYVARRV